MDPIGSYRTHYRKVISSLEVPAVGWFREFISINLRAPNKNTLRYFQWALKNKTDIVLLFQMGRIPNGNNWDQGVVKGPRLTTLMEPCYLEGWFDVQLRKLWATLHIPCFLGRSPFLYKRKPGRIQASYQIRRVVLKFMCFKSHATLHWQLLASKCCFWMKRWHCDRYP